MPGTEKMMLIFFRSMLLLANAISKWKEIYNGRVCFLLSWPIDTWPIGLFYLAVTLTGLIITTSAQTTAMRSFEVTCNYQTCENDVITCDGELMIAAEGCNSTRTSYYTECTTKYKPEPGIEIYDTEPVCERHLRLTPFYVGIGLMTLLPGEVLLIGIMFLILNGVKRVRHPVVQISRV